MFRFSRLLVVGALAVAVASACASPPPAVSRVPEPVPLLSDSFADARILLLGGSYVRSAAPAIVASFGSQGIEVLDASENGLMVGQFDSLLYDWRAEYAAYIDALKPDAVIMSIPIGLEALSHCQALPDKARGECLVERIATKVPASTAELAEFFADRGIKMLFYGDLAYWPGSGSVDGRLSELDVILYNAMADEEAAIARVLAEYGFQFVSVREALTGPYAHFWVQEPDGRWYNWRFPETSNPHWCPRGAANLAVLLAPYVAEGFTLSMADDWVDDAWNYDSWYLHQGCATEPARYPRYLPVEYDEATIERMPMAGFTEEVRSVVVPGDPAVCAVLDDSKVAQALKASTPLPLGDWSVPATLRPKWHELAVVTEERMQWAGGCRYDLQYGETRIDPQSYLMVVEWEESEVVLAEAFAATGHTVHPDSTKRVTLWVPPTPATAQEAPVPAGIPVAAVVSTGGRVFTVHAPLWPTIAVLRSAQLDGRLSSVALHQYQSWLDNGAAESDVAAALLEMATSLEP